ncbi:MAG: CoA-binding protein [Nanoarchaeota archaeon]|nr:CoA-binding protein [Nanoarchaeota archaeon]
MVDINDFFNKDFTYAIVGASNNEKKYGYKIVKCLIELNINVIPINLKENKILGLKTYKSLDVEKKIDVVNFVVPPNISIQILKNLKNTKINKVWFQPGSFNEECINYCISNKIKYLKDICLMKTAFESNKK